MSDSGAHGHPELDQLRLDLEAHQDQTHEAGPHEHTEYAQAADLTLVGQILEAHGHPLDPHSHPLEEHEHPQYLKKEHHRPFIGITTFFHTPISATEDAELLRMVTKVGRPMHRYSFSSSLPAMFTQSPMKLDFGRWGSFWSFKADPAQVASKALDYKILTFLEFLPYDGMPRKLVYHQEPENDMTPEQFIPAMGRIIELVKSVGRDDLTIGENLMGWHFDPANGARKGKEFIHPEADFVGISLFAQNTGGLRAYKTELLETAEVLDPLGIPMGISAIGASAQLDVTEVLKAWEDTRLWIGNRMDAGLPFDHCNAYHSDETGFPGISWRLDANASFVTAWRSMIDTVRNRQLT